MNEMLAVISGGSLLNLLVWVVIAGVVFYLGNWFMGYIGLGPPFLIVGKVILGLVVLVILVNALMGLTGNGGFILIR